MDMETRMLFSIIKTFNESETLIRLDAFTKEGRRVFSFLDTDGLKDPVAQELNELTLLKNGPYKLSFENKKFKIYLGKNTDKKQ